MATILCVWELGTDLGHLSSLRLPVEVALGQGHQVVLALRQLQRAKEVFGEMPVTYLQAPFRQSPGAGDKQAFLSYTHLIAHQCFSGSQELAMYLRAWRSLYALIQPDVVLFEHSPTALIAAHDQGFRKVLVGNGFTAPSPGEDTAAPFLPFPTTQRIPTVQEGLRRDDTALLACINLALNEVGAPVLPGLHSIYNQAKAKLLMTWPELNHFGAASANMYLGVEPPLPRPMPQWPEGGGARVFGYLHAVPSMEALLKDLLEAGVCALLFVRHLPPDLRERYSGPNMRFIDYPVDLAEVARHASWVINLGNHSTAATFAAAGVPQLLIPLHQEHFFLALKLVAQGSAVMAFQDQSGYSAAIGALQTNAAIRRQARALQLQLAPFSATDARVRIAHALAVS